MLQLGTHSDAKSSMFVRAVNDLEWLVKVVTCYGWQNRLNIRATLVPD